MLASTINRVQYSIGAGWSASYPVPFKYWNKSEIYVVMSYDDGVTPDAVLALDVDYSLTLTTPPSESNTLTRIGTWDPLAVRLTIYRQLAYTQETDYRDGEAIPADTVETDFDRVAARDQQINEEISRTVRVPITDESADLTLPAADQRANNFLAFDADGQAVPAEGLASAPVSAAMASVVSAGTLAAARTQLGVAIDLWDSAKAYGLLEVTLRNGLLYTAIQSGTNKDPQTEPAYWLLLPAPGSTLKQLSNESLVIGDVKSGTVAITIASPGVLTWTAHGLVADTPVILSTTGALPTGLTVGTVYYVRNPAANTFELSATAGGASINTSGSQNGTHTARTEGYTDVEVTETALTAARSITLPKASTNKGRRLRFVTLNAHGTYSHTIQGRNATVTISQASPGVVTWTAHGLVANQPVCFLTTGALPTGLTAGTTYYVKNPAANTFEVSATPGGASINTSSAGSGTHTGYETINHTAQWVMNGFGQRVELVSNGGVWVVQPGALGTLRIVETSGASQATPANATWYNLGGSVAPEPGRWEWAYDASGYVSSSTNQDFVRVWLTLSTANNSESDAQNTRGVGQTGFVTVGNRLYGAWAASRSIQVTGPVTWYLNAKQQNGGAAALASLNIDAARLAFRRVA